MLPRAYVVHQIRTRFRLRIPDKTRDRKYFDQLEKQLQAIPGITRLEVNTLSGSLLLHHPERPFNEIKSELDRLGLFEMTGGDVPLEAPMDAVMTRLSNVDSVINEASSGGLDLATLAFVGSIGLTLQQIARGNLVGPAIPMFASTLDMAYRFSKRASDSK